MVDRAAGVRGTFSGTVSFTPDDGGHVGAPRSHSQGVLRQRETGTVVWPTFTGPASRQYLLVPTDDPALMEVLFEDGRAFHPLNLSGGSWTAGHWCEPDTYQVSFSSLSPDRLHYEWDVTGPSKDLLLRTSLQRMG